MCEIHWLIVYLGGLYLIMFFGVSLDVLEGFVLFYHF